MPMTALKKRKWFPFRRGQVVLNLVALKYGQVVQSATSGDHYVNVRRADGTHTRWLVPNVRKVA
jgi:hypothetical protein